MENQIIPDEKHKGIPLTTSENLIVILLWISVLSLPITADGNNNIEWPDVFHEWLKILPYLAFFMLNHYILVKYLLFKKRWKIFLLINISLIILFTIIHNKEDKSTLNKNIEINNDYILIEDEIDKIDYMLEDSCNCIFHRKLRQEMYNHNNEKIEEYTPQKHEISMKNWLLMLSPTFFTILIAGFDAGLRLSFRFADMERSKAILEKQNSDTKLAYLKKQVSPHFFMNTLNNIHALIDIDTENAKEAVIRLSKLMRYLLYESSEGKVELQKEIEFISSYIDLMRLRYSEKVKINVEIQKILPQKLVPSLLFISIIENAFKHGISYKEESYVNIKISTENNDKLIFVCKNSIIEKSTSTTEKKSGGIGIVNTRKQLDLIYGDNYQFYIQSNKKEFSVYLNIPL
ncbi:MAG: histidine kinase [Bacteroidales bacterium]|nr:histidine kinase [Bacteroidales bacterium]